MDNRCAFVDFRVVLLVSNTILDSLLMENVNFIVTIQRKKQQKVLDRFFEQKSQISMF
jgi:hypothetical protein